VRITSDENTNSLVIIATPDQMRIIERVIARLDIVRKQVFVEAVIMELASEDSSEVGLGVHLGNADGSENPTVSLLSGQLGGSSLGLSQDLLTGMALGVFGPSIDVAVPDLTTGTTSTLSIPAFGVVLNAIQSNSSTNILSTPNILTMDNEEAKIVVGRNIPFPVSNSFNANGQPVISYQREDVAITLKVTPQINESNYVTLQVFQEVQEVEEDSSGLDVSSAGFITSKRSAETTVVIRDNQTVVLGGLMGSTDTEVETKVPILGDLPLLGRLFRGTRTTSRKTNLLIFLTPHVINEPADMEEIYRIKVAQRQEFLRRFYGKSREEQEDALAELLQYSMNQVDQPSLYRGPSETETSVIIETDETVESIGATSPASTPAADPRFAPETPRDSIGEDIEDIEDIEEDTDSTDTTE
jgi:general secretion pathway protein D